jgi:nicotinamidase-related amidase
MKLNPKTTALLTLDFQKGIIGMVKGAEDVIGSASRVVDCARKKQFKIIHVGLGFEEGHPEVPDDSYFGTRVKKNNLFVKGTPSVEFHEAIIRPEDLIVYKQRVSAFTENQLDLILRSLKIENLVFFGISTSGIALSTIRRAFDLDYKCTVIKDACFDPDAEVHRVLTEKVFPNQGTVLTAEAFVAEQG